MALATALALAMLQVGPGPAIDNGSGEFLEELRNRPNQDGTISEPSDPVSRWLAQCLDLIEEDPARAHSQAQIKRNDSTGAERVIANHCLGLAATELGLWSDARAAFIAARDETPQDELRAKARFGTMAGNAALGGGDPASALSLLAQARDTARLAKEGSLEALALIDLARAHVASGQADPALEALGSALVITPQASEPWLLKATLLRRLDQLAEAQTAIEKAIEIAPFEPEIALEAGVIAVMSGRDDAARKSWQSIVDQFPRTPIAEQAQAYLDQLSEIAAAKPEAP